MDIISERIRERRNFLGLTNRQLAALLNFSKKTVDCWIYGSTCPRTRDIPDICRKLGCTPNYLLGWEDGK